jgi:hypothetical protein
VFKLELVGGTNYLCVVRLSSLHRTVKFDIDN